MHEVQDLADHVDQLREVTAGSSLHINVTVEYGEAGKVDQVTVERVNETLTGIKAGWGVK